MTASTPSTTESSAAASTLHRRRLLGRVREDLRAMDRLGCHQSECIAELASALSDSELERELQLAERAALLAVRTRREVAVRRLHCLHCELQRRAGERPASAAVARRG